MTRSLFRAAAILAAVVAAQPSSANKFSKYTTVQHPGLGFSIAYPSGVFEPDQGPASHLGKVFVSPDGKAKLLVGAFDNGAATSLAAYRSFLLEENYAGALIDYAPVRKRWFVLSGERNGTTFYERVSFTCGGRIINSWAMLYPSAEKAFYDRVVEAVAPTYSPGAGPDGSCRIEEPDSDEQTSQ